MRTLLDEHDLRDDLVVLSVDAEGHDQIIVRSVDLSKITPYFIVFEHMHIMHSASGALRHVMESGYDCLMETENYFCVRDRAPRVPRDFESVRYPYHDFERRASSLDGP